MLLAGGGLLCSSAAFGQQSSYCYKSSCVPDLSQAESLMRADSAYGSLLQPDGRTPLQSDRTYTLKYRVEAQVPEAFYTSYASTSFDGPMPDCSSDNPLYPRTCSTEKQAMNSMWNRGVYRPKECKVGSPYLAGSYVSPYTHATEQSFSGRGFGIFHFEVIRGGGITRPGDSFRRADYQIDCGASGSNTWFYTIDQKIVYRCPAGFKGTAVAFNAAKPPIQGTQWCVPNDPLPKITVKLRQYESCPVNAHPCFPGTGDKMRVETDFSISGWPFSRIYHSLAELDVASISPGWSTSLSDHIIEDVLPGYVTPDGFYEGSVSASPTRYRSLVQPERVIEKVGNPLVGYRITYGAEIREFDASGRLTLLRDANDGGRDLQLIYSGGLLSQLRTAQGRVTYIDYEDGRLARIRRSDGSVIDYGYDSNGNLSLVSQGGGVKRYLYGEPGRSASRSKHLLTGIVDETGQRYASFHYDADGRVTGSYLESVSGAVEATTVTYTGANTAHVVTDGLGARTIIYSADQYRRPLSISDARGTATSTYAGALLTKSTDRLGVATTYAYGGGFLTDVETAATSADRVRVSYTRDALGRETQRTVSGAASGSSLRLLSSVKTSYLANGARSAACEVDPGVGSASSYICGSQSPAPSGVRQTLITYCSAADVALGVCPLERLVRAIDGPRTDISDITAFEYYSSDHSGCSTSVDACAWRQGDLWKITNAAGHATETLRYDGVGRALTIRDAKGVVTDFTYDALGRMTSRAVRGAN